jgi:hypothetical protein
MHETSRLLLLNGYAKARRRSPYTTKSQAWCNSRPPRQRGEYRLPLFQAVAAAVHFGAADGAGPAAPQSLADGGRPPESWHGRAAFRAAAMGVDFVLHFYRPQQGRERPDRCRDPNYFHISSAGRNRSSKFDATARLSTIPIRRSVGDRLRVSGSNIVSLCSTTLIRITLRVPRPRPLCAPASIKLQCARLPVLIQDFY